MPRLFWPCWLLASLTTGLVAGFMLGSGFGAVEAVARRGVTPASAEVAARFLALNVPLHVVHAATLVGGPEALLGIPLAARSRTTGRSQT